MPKTVIAQNGSRTQVATMDDVDGGSATVTVDNITDASAAAKTMLKASDAAAIRQSIGAGTSSLAIGTTSATAKAGDWKPASVDLPVATAAAIGGVKMAAAMADLTAAPTQADFNGLLANLRASGAMAP